METEKRTFRSLDPGTPEEINERLRRRYLDRLAQRVKRLRKYLVERNWQELRIECAQLANSGESFGFVNLSTLAQSAKQAIPTEKTSRALTPGQAKQSAEALIAAIDAVLLEQIVPRA